MNGNLMYEMARQRIAEQQRAARQANEAREGREGRAAARGRHAREVAAEIATPVIPDFAHEMFEADQDTVPARGRRGRAGR
jgi:protein subunit release factor B